MNARLKANLIDKLEEWVGESFDVEGWPDAYFGAETTNLMANAAATVFDAVVEIQEYGLSEGFFEKS